MGNQMVFRKTAPLGQATILVVAGGAEHTLCAANAKIPHITSIVASCRVAGTATATLSVLKQASGSIIWNGQLSKAVAVVGDQYKWDFADPLVGAPGQPMKATLGNLGGQWDLTPSGYYE